MMRHTPIPPGRRPGTVSGLCARTFAYRRFALPLVLGLALAGGIAACGGTRDTSVGPPRATVQTIDGYIAESSRRFNIPEEWIRAVMQVESGGRTHMNGQLITSHAGAMGLMQVMPATYEYLRRRHNLGPDPHHPRDNIMAGVAYIREMYDQFGAPGFLAAYNAGPGRYSQYLDYGRPLPRETQRYVALIYPRIAHISPDDDRTVYRYNSVSERHIRDLRDPG
jgi:hypothetical protein